MNIEYFSDGTQVSEWFYETKIPDIGDIENKYVITDYGVKSDGTLQTKKYNRLSTWHQKVAE